MNSVKAELNRSIRLPRYHSVLAACAVIVFFTDFTNYLFLKHNGPPPLFSLIVLGGGAFPLLLRFLAPPFVQLPTILFFALLYLTVSTVGLILSTYSELAVQAYETAFLSVLCLLLLTIVFSSNDAIRAAEKTIFVCLVISIGVNFFELFVPGFFSVVPGRSAGLYLNPNRCAIALVLGMISCIHVLGPKWRELLVIATGLGVGTTFSRAGVLVWTIAVLLLCLQGLLSGRRLFGAGTIAVSTFAASLALTGSAILDPITANEDLLARVRFFTHLETQDVSSDERTALLVAGWNLFAENPFLGAGIGATQEWALRASTHNMYLTLIAEHGVLGLLLVPLFAFSMVSGARGETRQRGIAIAFVLLVWSLVDHNIFDSRPILLIVVLQSAAALTRRPHTRMPQVAAGAGAPKPLLQANN